MIADKAIRFIDCQVPSDTCNLTCEYCYNDPQTCFGNAHRPFSHSVQHIAKALSKERFRGTCAFNLCGIGETLLHPELVPLAELLLQEGHWVFIVTNGTVQNAMEALFTLPSLLQKRLFVKFSFHYAELRKRNLLSRFIANVKRARILGISFTVELVAAECNVPFIDEIAKCCLENFGALCHVTEPRDMTKESMPRIASGDLREHQALWRRFGSELFEYRQTTWDVNRREEFCYAGEYSFSLVLSSGFLYQCCRGRLQNIFEDLEEPVHFMACGNNCPLPHCYNSHVWDCLVGVIPDLQSPSYAMLRNRVCEDGSEWLSPACKVFFSERLCELHEEYNEKRRIFTNGIMTLTHGNAEPAPGFVDVVGEYLRQAGIGRAAMHGDNRLSRWLLGNVAGLFFWGDELVEEPDAVIVADFRDIVSARAGLAGRTRAPVLSICDLHSARIGGEQ